MTMTGSVSTTDPCPKIPEHFVDPTRILKLMREIKSGVSVPERDEPEAAEGAAELEPDFEATWIPRPQIRTTVATHAPAKRFKAILAQAAWARASRLRRERRSWPTGRSQLDDAQRWFSDFVAILDFIHALSYIFAAAMAGRSFRDGWGAYIDWIQESGAVRSSR